MSAPFKIFINACNIVVFYIFILKAKIILKEDKCTQESFEDESVKKSNGQEDPLLCF